MIVCNLFGGPGCGKSTLAAGIFYDLKMHGINAELVVEFAKQLTWQKRLNTLTNQPYVFAKQLDKLFHLKDQVDIVVTDSPVLLSAVYAGVDWGENFMYTVFDIFNRFDNINFLINRVKPYSTIGRNQTEDEAALIYCRTEDLMMEFGVNYVVVDGNAKGKDYIVQRLLERLVTPK
jgi:hypothetical protein